MARFGAVYSMGIPSAPMIAVKACLSSPSNSFRKIKGTLLCHLCYPFTFIRLKVFVLNCLKAGSLNENTEIIQINQYY
jgi:hypothetical protein